MIHSPFADDFVGVSPPAENPKHNPGYDQEDEAQDGDEDDDPDGNDGSTCLVLYVSLDHISLEL